MRRLLVRRQARTEIAAAFDWYNARSSPAAKRFLEAVDLALTAVHEAPERHQIVRGQLRRVLLKGFPYAVYYKVYPAVISVVGVIHGRRHPSVWSNR